MNSPRWFKYAALAGSLLAANCTKEDKPENTQETTSSIHNVQNPTRAKASDTLEGVKSKGTIESKHEYFDQFRFGKTIIEIKNSLPLEEKIKIFKKGMASEKAGSPADFEKKTEGHFNPIRFLYRDIYSNNYFLCVPDGQDSLPEYKPETQKLAEEALLKSRFDKENIAKASAKALETPNEKWRRHLYEWAIKKEKQDLIHDGLIAKADALRDAFFKNPNQDPALLQNILLTEQRNNRLRELTESKDELKEVKLAELHTKLYLLFNRLQHPEYLYSQLLTKKGGKRITIDLKTGVESGPDAIKTTYAEKTFFITLNHTDDLRESAYGNICTDFCPKKSRFNQKKFDEYVSTVEQIIKDLEQFKIEKKYMVVSADKEVKQNLGVNVRSDFLGNGDVETSLPPNTLVEVIHTDPETGFCLIRWINGELGFINGFVHSSHLKPYNKETFQPSDPVVKKVKARNIGSNKGGIKLLLIEESWHKIVPSEQEMEVLAWSVDRAESTIALVQYTDKNGALIVGFVTVSKSLLIKKSIDQEDSDQYGRQRYLSFVE